MIIKHPLESKKWLLALLACIFTAAVILFLLEVTDTTHIFHKEKLPVVTASEATKGVPRSTAPSTTTKDTGSNKSDNQARPDTPPVTKTVTAPTGDFVSNHHPNLSGSPAPNTMTSVCTTTVGIDCKITFTNVSSGAIKSLPNHQTDAGGTAYWDWKLQDIGLTAGTWKIEAIASYGDQTKTATDIMNLEVAP